jgi:signal peptidase II
MRRHPLLIAAAVIALDRLTKRLVVWRLPLAHDFPIIPGFFQLSHWENTGAAFSMFAGSTSHWRNLGLIAFSIVSVAVIALLLWKSGDKRSTTTLALSLILGGALGNLWDRATKSTVTDFLDFYIASHHWPAFNIADTAVVAGVLLLLSRIFLTPRDKVAGL